MLIDFHTHIIPDKLPDMAAKYGGDDWPQVIRKSDCEATLMMGDKPLRKITDKYWAPATRLLDMDRRGVTKQVISPVPATFCYSAPAAAALEMCRRQNDFIAEVVARNPKRFIGFGTVPLQSPEMAIEELDRLTHDLGLAGVQIGTNVDSRNLDDPSLQLFFQKAHIWNVPIFVHPWEVFARERMLSHNFTLTVGMPSETALAAASLTWGGVMERYPGLRIGLAHGGGSFPYILPRLDQGWNLWPHLRLTPHPPSHYAKRLYFDSLVYDPRNVEYLIKSFGCERLLVGSDYPFSMGEDEPGKLIREMQWLTKEQRQMIESENVCEFLNIKSAG